MTDTPAFLADRLRSEGEKTLAFFSSLTPEQWQTSVYTEGERWTVRNILAHFVMSEQGFLQLFASILAGGLGVSPSFDIDRYNASQQEKTAALTPAQLLAQYQSTRAQMSAWVEALHPSDLEKQGRHPFLDQTSLAEMIKMVYRHNQIHHRDLRKVIIGQP